jgi:hypothetical protein
MVRFDITRFFTIAGAGVLLTIYLALISLQPERPPDWMVRGAFVFIVLPTAIFAAIVLSDWLTYFKEWLSRRRQPPHKRDK